jgi:hypothetical protein
MLSTAILNVLAKAILSGEPQRDAVAARLVHVLGRNWRWLRPLAGRYVGTFAGRVRPRRRDLISFLRVDPGLVEADYKYGQQIKILHWIIGPQPMQPIPAVQNWGTHSKFAGCICFREKRITEAFPPVLTGVMREQAPIDILYENGALSYRVSIGIAG